MSIVLRPYQNDFKTEIAKAIMIHKKVIACSATGSGKSKIMITIAMSALAKGRTVLIITESTKIFSQLAEETPDCVEIDAGSKLEWIEPNKIHIAMAQTLSRREELCRQLYDFGNGVIIINDEAHIGTATKLLQQFPEALLIGFTATPDARFSKHLPVLYNDCIVGPQPDELVQNGFLSPYFHFMRVGLNEKDLQLKGGEFTEESQRFAFEKTEIFKGLIDDLNKFSYKKCIIFTSSIKHCKDLMEILTGAYFNCIDIHSENSDSENAINMDRYRNGDINICVSVGVLTKGFDFPEIDLVILQRATTSLPLYLQMIGRGSRIADGKTKFTVLDYGLNGKRLGLWDQHRDWETMWKQTKKDKQGIAPVKECPQCWYLMAATITTCPNCGYVFQKQIDEQKEKETQLIELTSLYNGFRGKKIGDLSPKELAAYAKMKGALRHCIRVARAKDAADGIFLDYFAKEMGYKPTFADQQRKLITSEAIEFANITIR